MSRAVRGLRPLTLSPDLIPQEEAFAFSVRPTELSLGVDHPFLGPGVGLVLRLVIIVAFVRLGRALLLASGCLLIVGL